MTTLAAPEVACPRLGSQSQLAVQAKEVRTTGYTEEELEAFAGQLRAGFGETPAAASVAVTAAAEGRDLLLEGSFEQGLNEADRVALALTARDGPDSYKSILQPTVGYAIRCQHGRMALMKVGGVGGGGGGGGGGFLWLPYVHFESGKFVEGATRHLAPLFVAELKEVDSGTQLPTATATAEKTFEAQKSESSKSSTSLPATSHSEPVYGSFLRDHSLFSIYRYQIPDGQYISRYIFTAKWEVVAQAKKTEEGNQTTSTTTKEAPKKTQAAVTLLSCCTDTPHISWVPVEEVLKQAEAGAGPLFDRLWGYEVVVLAEVLQKQIADEAAAGQPGAAAISTPTAPQIQEFTSGEVLRFVPRPPPPTSSSANGTSSTSPSTPTSRSGLIHAAYTALLAEAKFTEKDIVKVYGDYVQHCHPSSSMTAAAFADYLGRKLGFRQVDESTMKALFRTFNFAGGMGSKKIKKSKAHYLLFSEFLLGLAVLEPVPSSVSKIRLGYVFRFYDRNEDGMLDVGGEFRRLVADLRSGKVGTSDQQLASSTANPELEADIRVRLAALKAVANTEGQTDEQQQQLITFARFLANGYQMDEIAKSGGGSGGGGAHLHQLLTTPGKVSIREAVHTRHAYEAIRSGKAPLNGILASSSTNQATAVLKPPFAPRLVASCVKCRPKKYALAYHTVRVPSGFTTVRADDPRDLSPTFSGGNGEPEAAIALAKRHFAAQSDRFEVAHSTEVVFNGMSVANRVLAAVRKLAGFNRVSRERQKEMTQSVTRELTPALIVALCKAVTEIVSVEPRVLKVPTPCFVIGDTHGNIHDVLTYEAQLWPLAPAVLPVSYLFLGDYVDRGDHGIEVISYLFAMKVLAPTKFLLLRGNHEIRAIQRNFTFFKECMIK